MPYMGSKRKLATRILAAMPQRDTLVDLFCGGCAVAHAAMDGNKFKNIIINDINPMCPELFINALSGKYNDEKRWISREDFERLKYTDPYVAVVWSFGNNLRDYLYSREIEPLKRAMHYAIYFGDTHPLTDILPGIDLNGLSDVTEERDRYLSVKHRVEEYLRTHRITANSNMQHFTASSLIADETGGVQIITKESRTATHRTETTYPSHESSMRNGRNGCCRNETNRLGGGVQIQPRTVDARTHQQETSPTSCGCNTESTTPGCFNYSIPNGGGGGGKSKPSAWTTARWRYRATVLSTATFPTRRPKLMAQRSSTSIMPSFTNGVPSKGSHSSSAATLCPTKTSSA